MRCGPETVDHCGQGPGAGELAAPLTICTDKISIAKPANGRTAIRLAATPQIATRKTAEYRRPAGLRTLALQCVKNLFYAVSQNCSCRLSKYVAPEATQAGILQAKNSRAAFSANRQRLHHVCLPVCRKRAAELLFRFKHRQF